MNRALTPILALAGAVLAGCAGVEPTAIDARDRSVFLPGARISVGIAGAPGAPSQPRDGHAIEFAATGASGSDSQALAPGQQPVVFGDRVFLAPQQLQHDFDFALFEVAYRFRKFFGNGVFGIEALAGLGYADLDMVVATPSQRASERLHEPGFTAGFGLMWRLRPATSVQARLSLFGSADWDAPTSVGRIELHLVQALGRNAAVRAGYSFWDVEWERFVPGPNLSTINLEFSGPSLGIELAF